MGGGEGRDGEEARQRRGRRVDHGEARAGSHGLADRAAMRRGVMMRFAAGGRRGRRGSLAADRRRLELRELFDAVSKAFMLFKN